MREATWGREKVGAEQRPEQSRKRKREKAEDKEKSRESETENRRKRENQGERQLYGLKVGRESARSGTGRCSCKRTSVINASGDWWSTQFKPESH